MKYTIAIERDGDAESPDRWEDSDVFLVTTRNRHFEVVPDSYAYGDASRGVFDATHDRFPLYAHIHSGVALSLSPFACPWDSGQIGFVLIRKGQGIDAKPAAEALVEEWNQYLSGDVWGYRILDEQGNEADSCWGMYGREYCESEAVEALQAVEAREQRIEDKCNAMMHL